MTNFKGYRFSPNEGYYSTVWRCPRAEIAPKFLQILQGVNTLFVIKKV